jgi:acyl-CoA synthetase (AMP-forming)/AMP-acid ligase II
MTVGSLVLGAALRFGDRTAIEGPDGSRTFADLAARATRLASGLRSLGLRPGDRVLELHGNTCAGIESDLALAIAGLVRVPLNPRLGPREWERIADDCQASALSYDATFADETESLRDGLGSARTIVRGDGPGRHVERLIGDATTVPPHAAELDDLIGLAYSSGTTGRPKGAMRTHRNRLASARVMTRDVLGGPPCADATFLHAGPVIHTSGLFVLPFLMAGARQVLLDHADPETILEAMERHGITHTALVPTMLGRLADAASGARPSTLRMLAYAGAPIPPGRIRQASERLTPHLVQYYGLVEAMTPLTVLDERDHARGLAGESDLLSSAGRVCHGVDLRLLDEQGNPVPNGEAGEVVVRGEQVMPGYWNAGQRDDLGKAVRDGRLATGDIGRLGPGGRLWLTDRRNDMIITGGYNVYPREIEDVITGVPGVADAAVVGLPDGDWGQRIVAAYTVSPDRPASPDAILTACRHLLPPHKRPKAVHRRTGMPLGATGKIDRRELTRQLGDAPRG